MSNFNRVKSAIWYSDQHFPHHDPHCLDVVEQLIQYENPDILINGGDTVDACQVSEKFSIDPMMREWLQDDIDQAAQHLAYYKSLLKRGATAHYLLGNHENRLEKAIENATGPRKEIVRLRVFQEHVTWEKIMADAGVGNWRIYGYGYQDQIQIVPNLITKHGTKLSQHSAYTGAAELRQHGRSGISGHIHRMGLHYKSDAGGNHVWAEGGCCCILQPKYMQATPNWQHGCWVIHYTNDWFNMTPVFIQDGYARYNKEDFYATTAL